MSSSSLKSRRWRLFYAAYFLYPRVSPNVVASKKYRDSDAVCGGTWEAFERVLQSKGYFEEGLRKIEAARTLSQLVDPDRNPSRSFNVLHNALIEMTSASVETSGDD